MPPGCPPGGSCVGGEVTAAVHFSPAFCPMATAKVRSKSGKTCPRWGHFSLRRLLPRRILAPRPQPSPRSTLRRDRRQESTWVSEEAS